VDFARSEAQPSEEGGLEAAPSRALKTQTADADPPPQTALSLRPDAANSEVEPSGGGGLKAAEWIAWRYGKLAHGALVEASRRTRGS
jgi:hypothetical protein